MAEQFNNRGFGQAFNGQGQSPQYGFTNNYQPSPQAQALGAVLNALQDPRNQWMGTGMAGGTIRGVGRLRNFFGDKEAARMGGFHVPTSKMQRDMPGIEGYASPKWADTNPKPFEDFGFPPDVAKEIANTKSPGMRGGYIDQVSDSNAMAEVMRTGNLYEQMNMREGYNSLGPRMQEEINRSMVGQQQLEDMKRRAMTQTEGPPPEMIRRLFGLKE